FIEEHLKSVRWMREQFEHYKGRKIVVVTHHAPSMHSVADKYKQSVYSAAFASHLDELVEGSGAALWIHGHSHGFFDYHIGDTRVICNSRGYPFEKTGFMTDMLIDV
ncbi:MAG: metallophosphatase, partial [Bacteroidales bacterium]|nr:metallophosphatase [Bacteroidales bacterium]